MPGLHNRFRTRLESGIAGAILNAAPFFLQLHSFFSEAEALDVQILANLPFSLAKQKP